MGNWYIKFFTITKEEGENIETRMLYGFCVSTNQKVSNWNFKSIVKTPYGYWTAILDNKDILAFEANIEKGLIVLEDKKGTQSVVLSLVRREPVLFNSNGKNSKVDGPVSSFHHIEEFWNVQKEELLTHIQGAFNSTGKNLFRDIQKLFLWLKSECGIDFSKNGHRLGNYEKFFTPPHKNSFEVHTDKQSHLKIAIIKRIIPTEIDYIVRCAAEHQGHWIQDQIKILSSAQEEVVFTTNEPMSRIFVQIWDSNDGQLVFSQDFTHMMSVRINMCIGTTDRNVIDPWTQNLLAAAQNRRSEIQKIEKVKPFSQDNPIVMKSSSHNTIDDAMENGLFLFGKYKTIKQQGAFVPKDGKDGEIGSFVKIMEYLNEDSVESATIVDPYFSVESAAKYLSRISNTNLKLDVITSLGNINPDTGEKYDAMAACEKFLHENAAMLHKRLRVLNLKRGEKTVFHDRYLIRYHQNGTIDGFLLSNSLNAAGRFYPFVTAPLEKEICLEISEYLEQLCSEEYQKTRPVKERIECEILTPSTESIKTSIHFERSTLLQTWVEDWNIKYSDDKINVKKTESMEGKFIISEADFPAVIKMLIEHRLDENLFEVLGEILSGIYSHLYEEFFELFKGTPELSELFLMNISGISFAEEKKQNHCKDGFDSVQYQLWAMLNEEAELTQSGAQTLINHPHFVYYSESKNLQCLYKLFLYLDVKQYVDILLKTKSPMMLNIIIEYMSCGFWSVELYNILTTCQVKWLRILAANWAFNIYTGCDKLNDWILEVIDEIEITHQPLQIACILSELIFQIRTAGKDIPQLPKWSNLHTELMKMLAERLSDSSEDTAVEILQWVSDCEAYSICSLLLRLSEYVDNLAIKTIILERFLETAEKHLLDTIEYGDKTKCLIQLYIKGLIDLYKEEADSKLVKRILDWNAFEVATEPARKNYDYFTWHKAYNKSVWQLELLLEFKKVSQNSSNVDKWICIWQQRIEDCSI